MPAHRKPLDEPYFGHHKRGVHNKTKPKRAVIKPPGWLPSPWPPDELSETVAYDDDGEMIWE
jgi:hypothetical protein